MEYFGDIRGGRLVRIDSFDETECPIIERFAPGIMAGWVRLDPDDLPTVGQEYSGPVGDLETVKPASDFSDPAGPPLVDIQTAAWAEIDAQAEHRRGLLLTPGAGQMATYQIKEAQAQAWQAASSPNITDADYSYLAAEIGITGETGDEVAVVILAMARIWKDYGAAIEKVRLGAKKAVGESADAAGVAAVLNGLAWPDVPTG